VYIKTEEQLYSPKVRMRVTETKTAKIGGTSLSRKIGRASIAMALMMVKVAHWEQGIEC